MKRFLMLGAAAAALVVVAAYPALAQDPLKVGPAIYKLLFENERVRVMEARFKPGQEIGMHSHPDHFVYVMSGGKIKITRPDGTSSEIDAAAGQVLWIPAETHSGKNVGTTEIAIVVSELKEPAPKPVAKEEKKESK